MALKAAANKLGARIVEEYNRNPPVDNYARVGFTAPLVDEFVNARVPDGTKVLFELLKPHHHSQSRYDIILWFESVCLHV